MNNVDQAAKWYRDREAIMGADRESVIYTPGARFQHLAWQLALFRALQIVAPIPGHCRILDIGCGTGNAVPTFYSTRIDPDQIFGIDLSAEYIGRARKRYPACRWIIGDATHDLVKPATFDLVMQSMMYLQVGDTVMESVAAAMQRAVRPGGHILFIDWRYRYDWRILTLNTLRRWFFECETIARIPGALVPPLGRLLSAHAQSTYFLIQRAVPLLVGQYAWLFTKRAPKQ